MLYRFLEENRKEILTLTEEKTLKLAGNLPSSIQLKKGLPIFFTYLIAYLKSNSAHNSEKNILASAAGHGRELMQLNYSISQNYGTYII